MIWTLLHRGRMCEISLSYNLDYYLYLKNNNLIPYTYFYFILFKINKLLAVEKYLVFFTCRGSPNIEMDEHTFMVNRERAVDYLNSLDKVIFPSFIFMPHRKACFLFQKWILGQVWIFTSLKKLALKNA